MGKSKGIRLNITLQCTSCQENLSTPGVFRYTSNKNRRNTPNRLELKKHCPKCNTHTTFKEIK